MKILLASRMIRAKRREIKLPTDTLLCAHACMSASELLCGERVHVCVYRLNLFVYNLSSTAQCRQIYISVVGIALAVFFT